MRLRLVGPILTLLLVGVVAAAWSGAGTAPAPVRPNRGSAPACPLTSSQERAAVLAFEEMMPVIRHPRCINCHGGVNPLVPYAQGGHMGGFIDTTQIPHSSVQTIRAVCQECHVQLPGWDTPGPPMLWVGKSSKQICMQFKRLSNDPADFIGHITNEHGGTQFIEAAFKGERALDEASKDMPGDDYGKPFKVEPPPGTHNDLIRQGTDWANTVGSIGWNATPDCGCEIHSNGWVGYSTATVTIPGPRYSVEEQATATVWFELDAQLSKGVREEYWKSTAGNIHWTVTYTGECVGTFSGTTPIGTTASGLGGDGNPLGLIQLTPRGNQVRYSVSNAPWQDQYSPITTVSCGASGTLQVAQPRFMSSWWQHEPRGEVVSPDGMHLQGSYQRAVGQGTMKWSWFFRRTTP